MAVSREEMDIILSARNNTASAIAAARNDLRSLGGVVSSVGVNLGALGAGLSTAAIVAFAKDAVKSLGDIADEADRVGVSTDALQTLQFQLRQSGGATEDAVNGLQRFAKAAAEANLNGNYLAKVLQANNVALKDSAGNLRSADALLEDYARLVANASSQQEKILLTTEAFGRNAGPKMVAMLERIARDGLPGLIAQGKEAGVVVDEALVRKADEIDDAWNKMLDSVSSKLKSLVVEVIKAGEEIGNAVNRATNKPSPMAGLMEVEGFGLPTGENAPIIVPGAMDSETAREAARARALGRLPAPIFTPTKLPPKNDVNADRDRNRTTEVIERLRLEGEQLTLNVEKRREAERLEAQINAIRAAGIDATAKDKEAIRGAVDALYAKKAAYEELKRQQDAYNEAVRFGGDLLIDSIQGLIDKTKDWNDVLRDVLNNLANALLKAAILGDGPLAGVTGMKSATGGVGGLLGMLFPFAGGRASGGSVKAGMRYRVGEDGAEDFVPAVDGFIDSGRAGGQRITIVNHNDFRGVDPSMRAFILAQQRQSERRVMSQVPAIAAQANRNSPGLFRK
jgi:hypothetical protein